MSQIPLPALARSGDDDLGFGLQRDLGEYEDDYFDDLEVKLSFYYNTVLFTSYLSK